MEKAAYRIIDANFNRAREALRVTEEFCRFAGNCSELTARAKQMRHELCKIIAKLDQNRLLISRDTIRDVGVGLSVENQHKRQQMLDCLTAAAKRLPEALRALSEMTQVIEPAISPQIDNLRYKAYTLEKDISIFFSTSQKFSKVRLYIIITSDHPADILNLACECATSGADCIQLRAKNIDDDQLFAVATQFVKICSDQGVLSIINDRTDIAVTSGADGVHLGQNDLPVEQAKKLQQHPMIIGKSTHSIEQLENACLENPTYIGLGPVFNTPTKAQTKSVGLKYLADAAKILKNTGIYSVAIGGINQQNIEQVMQNNITAAAICSAVTNAKNPAKTCKLLKAMIKN